MREDYQCFGQMALTMDFGPIAEPNDKQVKLHCYQEKPWNQVELHQWDREKFNLPVHSGFFYKNKFQLYLSFICSENKSFLIME